MIGVMIARYLAGIIIGYFLGSIPWGVIITKRLAKVDVRQYGSGNIGATNVGRVVGRRWGLLGTRMYWFGGAKRKAPPRCCLPD